MVETTITNQVPGHAKNGNGHHPSSEFDDRRRYIDLFKLFKEEAGAVPLLKGLEERSLSNRVLACHFALNRLNQLSGLGLLSEQDTSRLQATLNNPGQRKHRLIMRARFPLHIKHEDTKEGKREAKALEATLINEIQNDLEKEAADEGGSAETFLEQSNGALDSLIARYLEREEEIPQKVLDRQFVIINRGTEAYDHLVVANLRLAVSVARRFQGNNFGISDLTGYAEEGLMRAAAKFDFRRGYKFSTYAIWWIRQFVTRAIADYGRMVGLPAYLHNELERLTMAAQKLTQELGQEVTIADIAQDSKYPNAVARAVGVLNIASLDSPPAGSLSGDPGSFSDFIADPEENTETEGIVAATREKVISTLKGALTEKEFRVMSLRFGLVDGCSLTLEDVGKKFGVTRERIRQIEAKALRKLRQPKNVRVLRGLLDPARIPMAEALA